MEPTKPMEPFGDIFDERSGDVSEGAPRTLGPMPERMPRDDEEPGETQPRRFDAKLDTREQDATSDPYETRTLGVPERSTDSREPRRMSARGRPERSFAPRRAGSARSRLAQAVASRPIPWLGASFALGFSLGALGRRGG